MEGIHRSRSGLKTNRGHAMSVVSSRTNDEEAIRAPDGDAAKSVLNSGSGKAKGAIVDGCSTPSACRVYADRVTCCDSDYSHFGCYPVSSVRPGAGQGPPDELHFEHETARHGD